MKQSGVAPFRSFLFQGHVLDEKGNKMRKSLGNIIEADALLTENPVDLIRSGLYVEVFPHRVAKF